MIGNPYWSLSTGLVKLLELLDKESLSIVYLCQVVEQYLEVLNKDLKFYKNSIQEVSKDIRKEGYSEFPIFIASVFHNSIGEVILDAQEMGRTFTISASTLEELVKQDIIPEEKSGFFKESFKNPDEFACILMLTTKTQQFVFYPLQEIEPKASE